ncbi:DUF86 domain-containing protein [Porticoccaceae bacterium LTM1]|nr:DUF86 domain-containing protein [Porticoccaceae bacterium LTM1]
MQLLVEALIGCCKHLNKHFGLPSRGDAYQTILQLCEHRHIDPQLLPKLKGAIGMRNAIVHDYLNLDWGLIGAVIGNKQYMVIQETTEAICQKLDSPTP